MDSIQPTILIVDDEKHTRDGLRRLLEEQYDVYVAGDIAGALDVLERAGRSSPHRSSAG
jgi:CheY-like chemotaxis protein